MINVHVVRNSNKRGQTTGGTIIPLRVATDHKTTTPHHKHTTGTSPSPAQVQGHFITSGARLAQEYLYRFFLRDASNSPINDWAKAHALYSSETVRVLCRERGTEPTERVNIVIVIKRDLKRELCRERDRERELRRRVKS